MRRLYGPRTSSPRGRYTDSRKGLLNGIPYARLIRGVIIVRTGEAARIAQALEVRSED